jgi:hypothetical protein
MASTKDIFKNITKSYGIYFPELKEYRGVKIVPKGSAFLFHIKDLETGITTCGQNMEQCKNSLVRLLINDNGSDY